MPRRSVNRCSRRTVSADQLDELVECNLCLGDCYGFADLATRAEFARPWSRWRDEITARWADAYPGSRPMAAYLLGELPAPAWRHELAALRKPLREIRGLEVELLDVGWHRLAHEAEHLVAIGEIDADEYRAAQERLASASPLAGSYRGVSNKFHG